MGGSNAGRLTVEVDGDFSPLDAKMRKFGQTFSQTGKGIFVPVQVAADKATASVDKLAAAEKRLAAAQKGLVTRRANEAAKAEINKKAATDLVNLTNALNRSEQALAKANQQVGKLNASLTLMKRQLDAARAAADKSFPLNPVHAQAQAINKLKSELASLERAFKGKKLAPDSAAAKEIDRYKDAIERAGGASDRSLNFIQRHSTAINQLAFSAARAGSGFANFLPLIARSSTLLANMGGSAGGAGGALAKLKGAASGAVGAISGIAVAAVGAVAALALLVVGVGFLTLKLGPLGSALTKAQNSIKLIFEDAGQDMLKFAKTASIAFGITEQAALRFVGKTGQLFKSFGIGAEGASQLSKGLLATADVLRTTSTEFINSEDALQAVFDTVAGNVEGLRRFDIFLSEIGLTQVALRNNLKATTGAFDNVQRSLISQIAALEIGIERFEQYTKTADDALRISERTKAAFDSIKASVGQGFAPILEDARHILLGFLITLQDVIHGAGEFVKANEGLINGLKKAAEVVRNMQPGLLILGKLLGFLKEKGEETGESWQDEFEAMVDALIKAKEEFQAYGKILTVTDLEQLVDAHKRLREAILDAARAEREAIKDLGRAREDAVRDRADAQRDLAEAIEDAEEKLFEARKKVKDVEKKNFRDIRDAERALSRERLDSARRVDDAERALDEARSKRQDNILNANLSLFEALSAGDALAENRARLELSRALRPDDVKNAQLRLAREEFDAKEKIKILEEKLLETRLDAYEALKEAERELGLVIEENAEAIAEARRKLLEVEIEIARKLADSAQALRDARREGRKSIKEAETALDRLNFQFNTADLTLAQVLDKLERMKNALIGINQEAAKSDLLSPGATATPGVGALAHGGLATRGHPFLIGERGPELFIPNKTGTVISNDQLIKAIRAMSSGGGGGNYTVVEAVNPAATARAIEARMAQRVNN